METSISTINYKQNSPVTSRAKKKNLENEYFFQYKYKDFFNMKNQKNIKNNEIVVNPDNAQLSFQIFETYDYDMFKYIEGNRKIDNNNLKRLIESMKIKDAQIPILVTSNFYVIDGQHRLAARKQLMLPVYYQITDMKANADSIVIATMAQKPLSLMSIARLRADNGNREYSKLFEYCLYYNFPINLGLILTSKKAKAKNGGPSYKAGNIIHEFKLGNYYADDIIFADEFGDYIKRLYDETSSDIVKTILFIEALLKVIKMEGFNPEYFVNQVSKFKHLFEKKATRNQYQDMINLIYNYRTRKEKQLNLRPIK